MFLLIFIIYCKLYINKENKDNNKMDIDKENTVEIKKENEYYEEDNSNSSNITGNNFILY